MNKTSKILRIINLLHARTSVSKRDVMMACDVKERSFFRYMNTISEANIPVFHDEERKGYTLSDRPLDSIPRIPLPGTLFLLFALELLSRCVSDGYQQYIDEVRFNLLSHQPEPVEKLIKGLRSRIPEDLTDADISDLLSLFLIHTAVEFRRKLEIVVDHSGNQTTVRLEQPALEFGPGWRVKDNASNNGSGWQLSDVRRVKVLPGDLYLGTRRAVN